MREKEGEERSGRAPVFYPYLGIFAPGIKEGTSGTGRRGGRRGELPGGHPHGDPFTGALQLAMPLQVCVQAVACPLL